MGSFRSVVRLFAKEEEPDIRRDHCESAVSSGIAKLRSAPNSSRLAFPINCCFLFFILNLNRYL